jgi:hypothetical protein
VADRKPKLWRLLRRSLVLTPLLFGAPVALGIGSSLVGLFAFRYPELGWATAINADAEELYLGHAIYQSPAHGYAGLPYTPLFPTIVSFLDHVYLWNGWLDVLVILASVSLVLLAARVAYPGAGAAPRAISTIGAVGVGCIAYWCVASLPQSLLYQGRSDQLAWAFALFGLVAVADLGPTPSRRRVSVAVILLSAALWTKQTTFAAAGIATAWVLALAALSAIERRAALLFVAMLCGVNLVLLLVMNLATNGWEYYFNFEIGARTPDEFTYGENLVKGLQGAAVGAGFALAIWLICVAMAAIRTRARPERLGGTGHLRRQLRAEDPAGRRIALVSLFVVIGFVTSLYVMRKQGTETNQLIGVVWALGLLAAAGWRAAQRHLGSAVVTGVFVMLLPALAQFGPIRAAATSVSVDVPPLEVREKWYSLPSEFLDYTRKHTVYVPAYSEANVSEGQPPYPNYNVVVGLLAVGSQPLYLVHALLNRRFDAVALFEEEEDGPASGAGRWEQNYLWKLNQVINARYVVEPGLPPYLLARRPGPERAGWMRSCFGPFVAGGASLRIRRGGGFWCSFAADELKLVRTPAPLSEVVTTQPVRARGTIALSVQHADGAQVDLELDGESGSKWTARVTPVPGSSHELAVAIRMGQVLLASEHVPAEVQPRGRLGIRLGIMPSGPQADPLVVSGVGASTLAVPSVAAPFAIVASDGSSFDLHALHLGR